MRLGVFFNLYLCVVTLRKIIGSIAIHTDHLGQYSSRTRESIICLKIFQVWDIRYLDNAAVNALLHCLPLKTRVITLNLHWLELFVVTNTLLNFFLRMPTPSGSMTFQPNKNSFGSGRRPILHGAKSPRESTRIYMHY